MKLNRQKGKWFRIRDLALFFVILFMAAFLGTAVNLMKMKIYSSWNDLIENFNFGTFFMSEPAAFFFGGVLLVGLYLILLSFRSRVR
jgi:hypothetical protein